MARAEDSQGMAGGRCAMMDIHTLVEKAFQRDLSDPSALNDAFDVLRLLEDSDKEEAHKRNKEVRRLSALYPSHLLSLLIYVVYVCIIPIQLRPYYHSQIL